MVLSPEPVGGFRRKMSLRESLRRVGNRLRQSAVRKYRAEVKPTGGSQCGGDSSGDGPTVKRCRLEYLRLDSADESRISGGSEEPVGNQYEVIRESDYEEIEDIRVGGIENDYAEIEWEDEGWKDNVGRNKYEVVRGDESTNVNSYEVIRKPIKKSKIKGKHASGLENTYYIPRNEYEVVRREKKKKKKTSKGCVSENNNAKNVKEDNAQKCYEELKYKDKTNNVNTLLDEYLDRPENRGTLNPAFEDFTLKSNLVLPKKNIQRQPLKVIQLPLDDSFKENYDPNTVVVKKKRKYSVRFEIDEVVEEEVPSRRFGDVIFDRNRKKSILKTSHRHLQEEENDSTEELLIRNYELLTREGCVTREESNTTKFVRGKICEAASEKSEQEDSTEEELEEFPLPVVSLYCEPEDRMPSRKKVPPCRKKMKKKNSQDMLESKISPSDIKVLCISTTDSLNQPSTLRTDRLAKIVQKFGPEVLMAMGEDGGDSVLAQFKKTLEKPREVVSEVMEKQVEDDEPKDCGDGQVRRRGRKRKLVEDIYGKFFSLLHCLIFIL